MANNARLERIKKSTEEATESVFEDTTKLDELTVEVKLLLHNPKNESRLAFGPGVAGLCHGIYKYNSISKAAGDMHMAYSKAWKIINEAEDALGIKLVERVKPHGSMLTAKGQKLLEGYLDMQDRIKYLADALFDKTFIEKKGGK